MSTVTQTEAITALKKAEWFGLSWGRHSPEGGDQWCAASWPLIWKYGVEAFELRGDLYFPKPERLVEAVDVLFQIANWAETLGYIRRTHFEELLSDVYVFNQEDVTRKAREAH